MAVVGELTWGETSATVQEGSTVSVSYSGLSSTNAPTAASITTALNGVAEATTVANNSVTFRGLSEGTATIPLNTMLQTSGGLQISVSNALTITVTAAAPKYLDKDGLDYYDSLIATEIGGKQDTLTAGSGISISNNVISATANTFASYSNGTLYITNAAQNADTESF